MNDVEGCRKRLMDLRGLTRDQAKRVYLSSINGGCTAFKEACKTITKNESEESKDLLKHLKLFKDEMNKVHEYFSAENEEEFIVHCERKRAEGKDWNLKASYFNMILCDNEKKLLMAMYKELGSPMDCVLCYDGIMVLKIAYKKK